MAFTYQPILQHGADQTSYQLLTKDGVDTVEAGGRKILRVKPEVLVRLAKEAFKEISFYLRTAHLEKVAKIIDDPEATDNDRFVAATLLQNAAIAAKGELPMCQDTGTASIMAYKGEAVWTDTDDAEALSRGVYEVFQEKNLRYSQMAPLSMFEEKNTGSNLPAQIDIFAELGNEYHFLFVAKGGGSANKFFLHQKSKSLLNEASLEKFIREELFSFGTSACPPYHIAVVIGGTSAEACMKTAKLASTGYLDDLPDSGNAEGRGFRDKVWEERIFELAQETKVGAQFGGKYLAHDVRVIRLPRH
ncbi:MAG: fumarate hydratase, partial [Spirochaetia bacterium]|nr:fumarate hydratase [Spirochaetia bacterium]